VKTKTIFVSHLQVEAAKTVIEIAGGPEGVDPLIVKIAAAKPRKRTSSADKSV
jgi:hypothetical protein